MPKSKVNFAILLKRKTFRNVSKNVTKIILFLCFIAFVSTINTPAKKRMKRTVPPPWYTANYSAFHETGSLWKSREVFDFIYTHQNPSNCSGLTFMRMHHSLSGIGSLVHITTAFLALAIERNEVLIWDETFGDSWTNGEYCASSHSFECFFQPLSTCALNNVLPDDAVVHEVFEREDVVNKIPVTWHDAFQEAQPADGPNRDVGVKYWWRAIASAYILRLNERTSDQMIRMRDALHATRQIPWPLPMGTFSAHVRHSDKFKEMNLLPFQNYAKAIRHAGKIGREPIVFLSTEDPKVITDAMSMFPDTLLYTPYERTNPQSLTAHTLRGDEETFHSLLNLWIALESTYFVGQLGSNWNRLIDELRRVWVGDYETGGSLTRFIEVGCEHLDCRVDTNNW